MGERPAPWTPNLALVWAEFVSSRPPDVAASINRLVPNPEFGLCCRQPSTGGHYWIEAWDEHPDGKITVRITHLADSFLPGIGVFGVPEGELEPCGRDDIRLATEIQATAADDQLDAHLARGKAAAAAAGVDWETLTPEQRRTLLWGHP